ncbi:MAG: exosortase system-associated protein, TIGR04073 family [Candidatus Omnitrophica bacterium]|nr:exosortase system-associated protein, TIGR04073 family [Candidatus Omnitrophota bacterium]
MTVARRFILIMLAAAGCCAAGAPCVWAQDPIHKMGRGVVNVLTGWIELPKQLHLGSQEDNPVVGVGMGLAKGLGLTVLRAGVGAYEAATFPIPYPRQFASPYEQMEMPDYAWE